jgi:hypothetical protein
MTVLLADRVTQMTLALQSQGTVSLVHRCTL